MWLLGASNADQRKSIADYFRPTSHSNVTMGKLAGSDGMLGGRSVIDPDGFPFSAKQTAAMERVTPRSQGGPTENDPAPNAQERSNPESLTDAEKKQVAEQQDKANFDKLEKEVKENLAKNPRLENLSEQVKFVREKEGLRIEIIDKADFAMFGLGTTQLTPKAQVLLNEVAKSMTKMDNKLAIRGHTDSVAFANTDGRNNCHSRPSGPKRPAKSLAKKGCLKIDLPKSKGSQTAPLTTPMIRKIRAIGASVSL
jgi:chemotaxis protein MotB